MAPEGCVGAGAVDCEACDDGDPCTEDRCTGGICAHLQRPACPCQPACGGTPGRLAPGQVLRQGDGGLPGLAGPRDVVASPGGEHVYVAASTSGAVTHLARVDGALRWTSSVPLAGARALALGPDGLYAAGTDATVRIPLGSGALQAPIPVTGPAIGLATSGGWLAVATETSVELRRGADLTGTAPLGGVRGLVFSPDGRHLYAAAWTEGFVAAFEVGEAGLTPLGTLGDQPGLDAPEALLVTPGGAHVIVAGFCDHDVAILDRDPATGALGWAGSVWAGEPGGDCLADDFGEAEAAADVLRVHRPADLALAGDEVLVIGGSVSSPEVLRLSLDGSELSPLGFVSEPIDPVAMGTLDFVTERENQPLPDDPALLRGVVSLASDGQRLYVAALTTDAVGVLEPGAGAYTQIVRHGAGGVDGVAAVHELDLSPDGRHLYAAPRSQNAVGVFAVTGDGWLAPRPAAHLPILGDQPGVIGTVRVMPDGTQVVAADAFNPALHVLDRDACSGALTPRQVLAVPRCEGADPLLVAVRASPDGRDVYVSDFQREGASCLHGFRRDPATGVLAETPSTRRDDFLSGIEGFQISADGLHLYTGSYLASAVGHYHRDPDTGALTPGGTLTDPALYGAEFLLIAPDGTRVYVANPVEASVLAIPRDPATGALSSNMDIIADGGGQGPRLDGAAGLALSPDGQRLYVAAHHSDALNLFTVEPGGLGFVEAWTALPALDWVHSLRMSPDGRHLYAGALKDSAISAVRVVTGDEDGCGGTCP